MLLQSGGGTERLVTYTGVSMAHLITSRTTLLHLPPTRTHPRRGLTQNQSPKVCPLPLTHSFSQLFLGICSLPGLCWRLAVLRSSAVLTLKELRNLRSRQTLNRQLTTEACFPNARGQGQRGLTADHLEVLTYHPGLPELSHPPWTWPMSQSAQNTSGNRRMA